MAANSMPRYQFIANMLEEELAQSTPGSRIPSEHELAKRFSMNRLTAKAALEELERRYVVRRVQGKGTFVARRLPYVVSPDSPPSWTASVTDAGGRPTISTVSLIERTAPQTIAEHLRIVKGQRIFVLSRRRYIDGLIAGYTLSYLPGDLLPRFRSRLEEDASLNAVLVNQYRLKPIRTWVKVELRPAPPEVSGHLELRGTPTVHLLSAVLEVDGASPRVIEYAQTWLRPDSVDLIVEMNRDRGQ